MKALAPERSLAQRRDALDHANEIRTRRATLKRDLKAGRVQLADTLADPPDWLATAKVYDLLIAAPGIARVNASKILNSCRVSQSKTVGGISERQRGELIADLRRRAYRPDGRVNSPAGGDPAQRERALTAANRRRLAGADVKGRVGTGALAVGDVLRDPPTAALTMPIGDLLRAQHRWGPYRTRNFLAQHRLTEHKCVGALTERQRTMLTYALGEHD